MIYIGFRHVLGLSIGMEFIISRHTGFVKIQGKLYFYGNYISIMTCHVLVFALIQDNKPKEGQALEDKSKTVTNDLATPQKDSRPHYLPQPTSNNYA